MHHRKTSNMRTEVVCGMVRDEQYKAIYDFFSYSTIQSQSMRTFSVQYRTKNTLYPVNTKAVTDFKKMFLVRESGLKLFLPSPQFLKFRVIELHDLLRKYFQIYRSLSLNADKWWFENGKTWWIKKKKRQNPDRVKKDSSVVEGIPQEISLKMMPMLLILVFPSVEECQVQRACIHDELQFISFTECLYSEV